MPLEGEYEPSPAQWVRDQVELYESSGSTRGTAREITGAEKTERVIPVFVLEPGSAQDQSSNR